VNRIFKTLLILFVMTGSLHSQTIDDTTAVIVKDSLKTFKISISSNFPNARIFFDTSFVGVTPLINYEVKEGPHSIRVHNPKSLKDWDAENEKFEIFLNSDTSLTANFRYYYFFNTDPFGARTFYKNDSLLGDTPLRFFSNTEMKGNVLFKKKNYKDYTFDLNAYDFETGANIKLQPKGNETVNDVVFKNRGTQFKTKRSLIPILSLAAASIAGGYFSIDFKNKANAAYDDYLDTGSTLSLDDSRKNDKYFVVSLVLMQAAVGTLIYFLFFDK